MLALKFCFMSNILWYFRFSWNTIETPSCSCRYFKLFERLNRIFHYSSLKYCTRRIKFFWLSYKWSCTFFHARHMSRSSGIINNFKAWFFKFNNVISDIFPHKNDPDCSSYISIIKNYFCKMDCFRIFLFFLQATSAVGDLIGWNRLQGATLIIHSYRGYHFRSTTKQAKFKQLKSVFDQYLIHLERNSPQQMSKLIQIKKLQYHGWSDRRSVFGLVRSGVQYQKYLETVAWLIFTTTYQ